MLSVLHVYIYVKLLWHFLWFAGGWRHRHSGKSPPWSSATATPTSSSYMKSTTIRWGWLRGCADLSDCPWRLQEKITWIYSGTGRRQINVEVGNPPSPSFTVTFLFTTATKQTSVFFIPDLFVSLTMLHVQHECVWSLSLVVGKVWLSACRFISPNASNQGAPL